MNSGRHLEPGAEFNAMSLAEGWAGICDPTLAFRRGELATLSALWRQAAGDAPAPKRSDMKPSLLKFYLPHVVIYERVGSGPTRRYRVRLMGTQFAQVMGELTGKFLDDELPAPFMPRWNAALDAVLNSAQPLRFISRSDTANKSYLVGEFFEAPLLAEDGAMNLVFAAGFFTPAEGWKQILPRGRASVGNIGGIPV
jgi:hypothetical protein